MDVARFGLLQAATRCWTRSNTSGRVLLLRTISLLRHVGEARQVKLISDRDGVGGTVSVLTKSVMAEQVVPQPGGFDGGWVTSRVVGPFKGLQGAHSPDELVAAGRGRGYWY